MDDFGIHATYPCAVHHAHMILTNMSCCRLVALAARVPTAARLRGYVSLSSTFYYNRMLSFADMFLTSTKQPRATVRRLNLHEYLAHECL